MIRKLNLILVIQWVRVRPRMCDEGKFKDFGSFGFFLVKEIAQKIMIFFFVSFIKVLY